MFPFSPTQPGLQSLPPPSCHVILANLRPSGTKGYVIPRGFLFNFITCPNYTGGLIGRTGCTRNCVCESLWCTRSNCITCHLHCHTWGWR